MSRRSDPDVTIYADYVCPFCYLGYASLDQYRASREEPLETDWHPFDLRRSKRRPDGSIDHSVDDGKDDAYFAEAKRNVRRLADRYDVEMVQELAREIDSFPAQRVAWRVRDAHPDSFEPFHRSVFDALWEDGRDISDQAVLADLASEAELPDDIVEAALTDEETAEALEIAFDAARRERITGVPTFVSGEHAARGAVPPEQLRRLLEGV